MLDGAVKTLHPKVHAGILARRDLPSTSRARAHAFPTIDSSSSTSIRFARRRAAGCTLDEAIENIDIGGPTMVRAAAKNWPHVGVVVDPADYDALLAELARTAPLSRRDALPARSKAFAHTASYDGAIANWLTRARRRHGRAFPDRFNLQARKCRTCATARTRTSRPRFYRDERRPPDDRDVSASCRARSSRTTTSPTATPRGSASRRSAARRRVRDRQARESLRRRARAAPLDAYRSASPPIPSRRSAASSRSTAGRRRNASRRCRRSSSKC
jgi:hypothetical protein